MDGIFTIGLSVVIYLVYIFLKSKFQKAKQSGKVKISQDLGVRNAIKFSNLEEMKKIQFELSIVGKIKDAISLADIILDLDPNDYYVRGSRGASLIGLNYNLDAIDDLLLVLEHDPKDWNSYGLVGLAYQRIGNIEKSKEFYKKSIENSIEGIHNNYTLSYSMFEKMDDKTYEIIKSMHGKPDDLKRRERSEFKISSVENYNEDLKLVIKKELAELEKKIDENPDNAYFLNAYKKITNSYAGYLRD